MHLGSLELQIFVALVLVLATAFVALVCDFLKGNNEQLRERNIELRVRHDERERMGLFEPLTHPVHWLQGLTALMRTAIAPEAPVARPAAEPAPVAAAAASAPAAPPAAAPVSTDDLDDLTGGAADRNPQRRHRYDEFKDAVKTQSWATKEELEQLAGRAARIRARHEASQKKHDDPLGLTAPAKPVEAKPVEVMKPALVAPAPPPAIEFPAKAAALPVPELETVMETATPFVEEPAAAVIAPAEVIPAPAPAASTPWVFRLSEPEPHKAPAPEALPLPVAEVMPESKGLDLQPEPMALEPVAEPVVEAPVPAPIAETPALQMPALRTRIQAIEIPTLEEAVTEDLAIAPAAETAVTLFEAPAEPVPAEAAPALDVVALQRATGESRAAASMLGETAPEGKLDIPPGLHESAVLSLLIENQTPFSGVVVAIGLNDYETLREKLVSGADSAAALNKMVLSMLRPQDFGCRFQDDEYILIYPGERGSSAQRRLFQVSEKLWDFQLRSLGNLSVMFSWGGLEVTNETLSEAVASARERMYQTKRNRKPASLDFAVSRKKVVNG